MAIACRPPISLPWLRNVAKELPRESLQQGYRDASVGLGGALCHPCPPLPELFSPPGSVGVWLHFSPSSSASPAPFLDSPLPGGTSWALPTLLNTSFPGCLPHIAIPLLHPLVPSPQVPRPSPLPVLPSPCSVCLPLPSQGQLIQQRWDPERASPKVSQARAAHVHSSARSQTGQVASCRLPHHPLAWRGLTPFVSPMDMQQASAAPPRVP